MNAKNKDPQGIVVKDANSRLSLKIVRDAPIEAHAPVAEAPEAEAHEAEDAPAPKRKGKK